MKRNSPSQKRSRERLDSVLAAAKRELSEKGYSALSISQVCARANVKPASIYRYWPDKTAILESLMDEFEETISNQMKLRIAEKLSFEQFIASFLNDLQYYCSYDNWIMQAQIGMRAELAMHGRHEQSIHNIAEIVKTGLAQYCSFGDSETERRVSKSVVLIVEAFLMALGRNTMLGHSSKGLRADFEEVMMNHIRRHCVDPC